MNCCGRSGSGNAKRPARPGLPDRCQHLAPKDGHHHPGRQQKAVPHGDPLPRRRQPTPRDQAVHVRMQHEGLAPGVERRKDARLSTEVLGVRQ